ncbi:MAG: hypothetical protein QOK08_1592 [Actinomycetota bacterium]|jgi:hypothetical protein|nr:hypothetical protein [Actinomycetota bacterium]
MLRNQCGSMRTDQACPPRFDPHAAGIECLHPLRDDFEHVFEQVEGVGFDDVVAVSQPLVEFGAYLPQVAWDSALSRERVAPPHLGVRVDEVMRHGRVRTADELRSHLGLKPTTRVTLLLFAHDDELEAFADGGQAYLDQVAAGGYSSVTAPSYSLWMPRRRPDNLLSLRRSMLTFEALQARGVTVLPRVGWVEQVDMLRFAEWISANPHVGQVSLDLMTYKAREFSRHTSLLAEFDALTGERLHYFVNGVAARKRIVEIYLATAAARVTVTDATMRKAPRIGANGKPQPGFRARTRWLELRCERARADVTRIEAISSPEELLDSAPVEVTA